MVSQHIEWSSENYPRCANVVETKKQKFSQITSTIKDLKPYGHIKRCGESIWLENPIIQILHKLGIHEYISETVNFM